MAKVRTTPFSVMLFLITDVCAKTAAPYSSSVNKDENRNLHTFNFLDK
jgi:hypothetical protein